MWLDLLLAGAAIAAGAVAAVTGFGIGSLLTPLFALQVDTSVAVAAVSVPHVIGTGLRLWLRHGAIDRRVLWTFGLTSAAGGLVGAALHTWATNRWLTILFGVVLLFAAAAELTGLTRRLRFGGWRAWMAGAFSGLLGGLVGNQGGIRSAALLGFHLSRETFVATATAVALLVDGARIPIYLALRGEEIAALWRPVALSVVGVAAGTIIGNRALTRIPEVWFRIVLAVVLALLGGAMLIRGTQS